MNTLDKHKVEQLEAHNGEGFMLTKFSEAIGLARANSLWPLPFATSCCGIEFMATMAAHYDLARFGSERLGFTPRQCDLLMVMGKIPITLIDLICCRTNSYAKYFRTV